MNLSVIMPPQRAAVPIYREATGEVDGTMKNRMKKQKKTPGFAYKILTIILLVILVTGFCTVQAICNVVSQAGLIWFALIFINFVIMALEDFNYVKTHYGGIPVRGIRLTLAIIVVLAPASLMLPLGKDWRPYTFESERVAIEAARAIPDEQNAAMLYQSLFEDLGPDPELPEYVQDCEKSILRAPWSPEIHPKVAEWVQTNNDTIDTLMQISEVHQCRFPIRTYSSDFSDWSGRPAQLKYLVRLLLISANLDMMQNNKDTAITKYFAVINIGKHHLQQPVVLDFLIGLGTKALVLRPIRNFIIEGDPTGEDLKALAPEIEIRDTWNNEWPKMLEVEMLQMKNHLGRFYEINPRGRTRLTHHNSAIFEPDIRPSAKDRLKDVIAPAFFVLVMPWRPETVGEVMDDMYAPLAKKDFDWKNLPEFEEHRQKTSHRLGGARDILMTITLSPFVPAKIHDIYLRVLSVQRGTHVLVALKQYHTSHEKWPETLDEIAPTVPAEALIDPINGGEFVYSPTDDGFKLYSKGKNGIDENGEKEKKTGADDIMIWPLRDNTDKTKESNEPQQDKENDN